ncbi:MAG TPA: serine protease [Candidatus Dormibacteraeota bacterium]|nr:serine protease [Candidatus Dormibacteraeota bacterium]
MHATSSGGASQRRRAALIVILAGTLVLSALAAVAFAVTLRLVHVDQSDASSFAPPAPRAPAQTGAIMPLADVAAIALDAVVTVEVAAGDTSVALGTGWLLDDRGDVVTNQHVIANQRRLRLVDRHGNAHTGTVVGVDPEADLAVLRATDTIDGTPLPIDGGTDLPLPEDVVVLASARATGHGDSTGEQLVRLHQTVPLDRLGSDLPPVPGAPSVYSDMMVLTGAVIYRGNSGGPVLDARGAVIGIVTLASETAAQAFAIPCSRVLAELRSLAGRTPASPSGTP